MSLELLSRSLVSPSGQDLQPSTAALRWAEEASNKDVSAEAWAALGVSVQDQVSTPWLQSSATRCELCRLSHTFVIIVAKQ